MNNTPAYLFSITSHPDTIHINSLKITFFKPEIDFQKYDYLIATSKQVSKALEAYEKKEYIEKEILCISKQSANSLKALGCKILNIGGGYGDDLSGIIEQYPKEKKWLYLRAEEIASSFREKCLQKGYNIDEKVVYKSSCSNEIQNLSIPKDATLIFTSPSSVKCFLQTNSFTKNHKIIVIGKTTAKALDPKLDYMVSSETTIKSCLDLV
jgi:uroporphyrinogen-III synthase